MCGASGVCEDAPCTAGSCPTGEVCSPDPEGEREGAWRDRITFSAKIDALYAGELVSRAVANFSTPAAGNQPVQVMPPSSGRGVWSENTP